MRKYLIMLAVLTLSGCAHAQYKTSYFQEFATHDCNALKSEMAAAREEESRIREKSRLLKKFVVFSEGWGPKGSPGSLFQVARMRVHARQEAIIELQKSKGCRPGDSAANKLRRRTALFGS